MEWLNLNFLKKKSRQDEKDAFPFMRPNNEPQSRVFLKEEVFEEGKPNVYFRETFDDEIGGKLHLIEHAPEVQEFVQRLFPIFHLSEVINHEGKSYSYEKTSKTKEMSYIYFRHEFPESFNSALAEAFVLRVIIDDYDRDVFDSHNIKLYSDGSFTIYDFGAVAFLLDNFPKVDVDEWNVDVKNYLEHNLSDNLTKMEILEKMSEYIKKLIDFYLNDEGINYFKTLIAKLNSVRKNKIEPQKLYEQFTGRLFHLDKIVADMLDSPHKK